MKSTIEKLSFFKKFLSNPTGIGAIAPSSAQLTQSLLNQTDMKKHNVIVELGPGTGVFTKAILEQAKEDVKLICIEQDTVFANQIRNAYPHVDVYTDSAENLQQCLSASGITKVCLIISGIPFAALENSLQRALLFEIKANLSKGCVFQTFSYLHSPYTSKGRRFQKNLSDIFGRYERSEIVWKNLPPAFWYTAKN